MNTLNRRSSPEQLPGQAAVAGTATLLLCSQSQANAGCCNPVKHLALWSNDIDHAAASQLSHTALDGYKLILMH